MYCLIRFTSRGETYYEDISLTTDQFYQKLNDKIDVATSQPSPESVTELWDKALQDHEELVYIPMSSGLSGSCSSAYGYSQEPRYEGRVYVIDNQRISVTQRQSVLDAMMLADMGKSAKEIHDILTADKFNSSIYIMLDTLYYLKKRRTYHSRSGGFGHVASFKAGITDSGGKAGYLCQGPHSQAGQGDYDRRGEAGY